jgi:hypothetical protein
MPDPRVSVSFRLPRSLVERARRAARDHAGKPNYLTLGKLVQAALEAELIKYDDQGDDEDRRLPPAPRQVQVQGVSRRCNLNAR